MSAAIAEVRALGRFDPLRDPSLYRELTQRYLVWDAYVGGERRVDLHPLVLPEALHLAAANAACDVVRAVGAVCERAHSDPEERARYGLHPDVLELASASHAAGDRASLFRVDLLLGEDGAWHACEINADCPGGHNEAFGLPRLARAAGFLAGANPTRVVEAFAARIAGLSQRGIDPGAVGLLFATAYAEDLQVCAILQRAIQQWNVPALLAPPTAPRLKNGRLYVGATPVTVLYRYFPAEYMEGQKNLGDIAAAVRSGAVQTMSSFRHIFVQSKLGMARAWALKHTLGRGEEVLVRHLPETFDLAEVSRAALLADRGGWVVKRALGRVGDEVFVGAVCDDDVEWTALVDGALSKRSRGEPWIAQRFIRQRPVPTPWGPRYVTLGAYVLDGAFCGYFARVTRESHVSHDALVVPVFVE
jgi:glutathionylspermidine synthase